MEQWRIKAENMVNSQIAARGITDLAVMESLLGVPRHIFVPEDQRHLAYEDIPLPIGRGQTISQPYMVALMTERLRIEPGMKVLEIGTGSGYQAAILANLGARVHSIERIGSLAISSAKILEFLGFDVRVRHGDGRLGIPEEAPFDRILVTAGSSSIPSVLIGQAGEVCRIVIPIVVNNGLERLLTRAISGDTHIDQWGEYCRFVPLLEKISE